MRFEDVPFIETPRLILRLWKATDYDSFSVMMADPSVAHPLMGSNKLYTRDESWWAMSGYIGHWIMRGHGTFAIEEKSTHEFIGRVGSWHPPGVRDVEYTIAFASRCQGQGFFAEVFEPVYNWLFTQTDLVNLLVRILRTNTASLRAFTKCEAVHHLTRAAANTDHSDTRYIAFRHLRTDWAKTHD